MKKGLKFLLLMALSVIMVSFASFSALASSVAGFDPDWGSGWDDEWDPDWNPAWDTGSDWEDYDSGWDDSSSDWDIPYDSGTDWDVYYDSQEEWTQDALNTGSVFDSLSVSENVAVSADVLLSGYGTGYHAKIVIGTGSAAVSFGIQHDEYASYPYTGNTVFLVENVLSGYEQEYTRFEYEGSMYAAMDTIYNLTLAVNRSTGEAWVYVNDELVGEVSNPNLANQQLYIWVEGAARKNGDSVYAQFENVRIIENGEINDTPMVSFVQVADGLYTDATVNSQPSFISVGGELTSLDWSLDWDSAPSSVNGYVRFY